MPAIDADNQTACQPFLRWAGGKRRLLPALRAATPKEFGRYFEPFVGGGAMFFDVPAAGGRCVINDVNPHLVAAYRQVRDGVDDVIAGLKDLAVALDKDEYLRVRSWTPDTELERAVRMIYLNRTCFNGLWRENSAGEFNVPYGNVKNPRLPHEEQLRAASARLQGAVIRNCGFEAAVEVAEKGVAGAQRGDFVYLDPPYIPLSASSSFSKYSQDDFVERHHDHLAGLVRRLSERGVYVMMSNSYTELTRRIYAYAFEGPRGQSRGSLMGVPRPGLRGNIHTISAPRTIAASGTARTPVPEVLAVNYQRSEMKDRKALKDLVVAVPRSS